jgi:hypothetical protein
MPYSSEVGRGRPATTTQPAMTYKDLLDQLQQLDEEQLNSDVAIHDTDIDEYFQASVEFVFATDECQVLDADHPVIRF